jgi:integrase/recombinase XerD
MQSEIIRTTKQTPIDIGAASDDQLIALWLHGRPQTTQRAYRADIAKLIVATSAPIAQLTLGDLQAFADSLAQLAPASAARTIGSVKSLFAFAMQIGYLRYNVAAVLRMPTAKNTISRRLLSEEEVMKIITLEETHGTPRNATLLRLLYTAALRVAEATALRSSDLATTEGGAILTVYGKGAKTRHIRIERTTTARLLDLVRTADDAPIFISRKHGPLSTSAIWRIVAAAAIRAGVRCHTTADGRDYSDVSPHWFRHAHASHAIERGAPLPLVQATLGHASIATTGIYAHARPSESSARFLPLS